MLIMPGETPTPGGGNAMGLPALVKREAGLGVGVGGQGRADMGNWGTHASVQDATVWRGQSDETQVQTQAQVGMDLAALPDVKPKKKKAKEEFVCNELHCGKTFPRSFALRRHMRIHTGNKPYACDYEGCSQRFNTSGNLSRHKRIHSGERPYPCIFSSCGKRFNTSTKLKRHMKIHFPEGQNLFRCVGGDCTWSCDNYKEFAQHQKLHHNVIVGAQQEHAHAREQAAAVAAVNNPSSVGAIKDNEYFSTADSTRSSEYDHLAPSQMQSHLSHHHPPPATGSFLYGGSFPPEKPKTSVLPPPPARSKIMGQFFGGDLMGAPSLPGMLPKDQQKKNSEVDHLYSSDQSVRRGGVMKSGGNSAFPSVQYPPPRTSTGYDSAGSSFALSSDSSYSRSTGSYSSSSHFAPLRPEDTGNRGDDSYSQQQQQHHVPPPGHHVLRPPPQGSDESSKFGGFSVPPPMNPAAPEFTGEELNVVLQLMNENYC